MRHASHSQHIRAVKVEEGDAMHPLTLPRAPAETLMAVNERDGLPISSLGRSGGRFPAAAGLFFRSARVVHAFHVARANHSTPHN